MEEIFPEKDREDKKEKRTEVKERGTKIFKEVNSRKFLRMVVHERTH